MKNRFTKEQLTHEYVELKQNINQIGEKYGITGKAVWLWLKKLGIPRRREKAGGRNLNNLIGKKYGILTVIKKVDNPTSSSAKWLCKCLCGNTREVVSQSLTKGLTKSCGCRTNSKMWKGYEGLSSTFWSSILTGARRRNLEVDVSIEDAWKLFIKQNRKCALSGLDIVMEKSYSTHHSTHTASLDRIDSSKGYTKDNIQWVHKRINLMKSNMSDTEFVETCKLVSSYNRG